MEKKVRTLEYGENSIVTDKPKFYRCFSEPTLNQIRGMWRDEMGSN